MVEFCNNAAAIIIRIFISPYRKEALTFSEKPQSLVAQCGTLDVVQAYVWKGCVLLLQQLHLWDRERKRLFFLAGFANKRTLKNLISLEYYNLSPSPPYGSSIGEFKKENIVALISEITKGQRLS